MKEKNIDFKQQTIRMDMDTHKAFKMWCVQNDVSMNVKINELIEEFMEKLQFKVDVKFTKMTSDGAKEVPLEEVLRARTEQPTNTATTEE